MFFISNVSDHYININYRKRKSAKHKIKKIIETRSYAPLLHSGAIRIFLDTWSGFEAAMTAPWPSRGKALVGDSTTLVN